MRNRTEGPTCVVGPSDSLGEVREGYLAAAMLRIGRNDHGASPDKGSQPSEHNVCLVCSLSSLWQRPCGVAHRQCSPCQQSPCHSICQEPRTFSHGTER